MVAGRVMGNAANHSAAPATVTAEVGDTADRLDRVHRVRPHRVGDRERLRSRLPDWNRLDGEGPDSTAIVADRAAADDCAGGELSQPTDNHGDGHRGHRVEHPARRCAEHQSPHFKPVVG